VRDCIFFSLLAATRLHTSLEKFRHNFTGAHIDNGLRSDNRLESVANVHTAADLHVHPVSQTALVIRSWAPRAIKEIHDARFQAISLRRALSESSQVLQTCRGLVRKQVFESARGIACVTNIAALAKNFHKLFKFAEPGATFQSAWCHYGDK
jgi:hypothetical protein